MSGYTIAHGIPVYRDVEFHAFVSMVDLHREWKDVAPEEWGLAFIPCRAQPVHVVRERIAEAATRVCADVLLFQDSDVAAEPREIMRLLDTLVDSDPSVALVGAPCLIQAATGGPATNGLAGFTVNVRSLDGVAPIANAPFEVAAIGFGLVAIRCEVFRSMPRPWFQFASERCGEDVGFCDRVRNELGRKVLCEPRVRPRHTFPRSFGFGEEAGSLAHFLSQ